jgi:transcriptional regulator with XRE-family HTH domain
MTDEQRERADRFELAERSGLSADAIYKIGRGDRAASVDSLALLAFGLDIEMQMFWLESRAN